MSPKKEYTSSKLLYNIYQNMLTLETKLAHTDRLCDFIQVQMFKFNQCKLKYKNFQNHVDTKHLNKNEKNFKGNNIFNYKVNVFETQE